MASAFDWSPGGCCCGALDSLFDIYGIYDWQNLGLRYPNGFVRVPTIFPNPTIIGRYMPLPTIPTTSQTELLGYDSNDRFKWVIPPLVPVNSNHFTLASAVGGYQVGSERVWTEEMRDGVHCFVLYDAITKSELLVKTLTSMGVDPTPQYLQLRTVQSRGFTGGVSQSRLGFVAKLGFFPNEPGFAVTELQSDGTVRKFPGTANAGKQIICCLAPRLWPRAAATIYTGAVPDSTATWRAYFGDLNPITLSITNQTTIDHSIVAGDVLDVMLFDSSPTHWVAVVEHGLPNNGGNVTRLFIDGQKVIEYPIPFRRTPLAFAYTPIFQSPHVAFPHDTLGDGYVIVPQYDYASPPSAGNPTGTFVNNAKPWTAVIYKATGSSVVEVARLPRRAEPLICKTSSDRWLYLTGWINADRPASCIAQKNNPATKDVDQYWLVRHDASQSCPVGVLPPTGVNPLGTWPGVSAGSFPSIPESCLHLFAPSTSGTTFSTPLVTSGGGTPGGDTISGDVLGRHDCVKNSALVTLSLPADLSHLPEVQ